MDVCAGAPGYVIVVCAGAPPRHVRFLSAPGHVIGIHEKTHLISPLVHFSLDTDFGLAAVSRRCDQDDPLWRLGWPVRGASNFDEGLPVAVSQGSAPSRCGPPRRSEKPMV